eukprot:TRINITY_DN44977_c0_g1_i1.p1 TRINITY_DN44977_c0_g1~~TRINITY_DN44977_c0_g1_i1.p1  ORF type:complete len:330 (+),score=23.99 TRINITY_DN44977_c0_g1_i1:88-1077(+)
MYGGADTGSHHLAESSEIKSVPFLALEASRWRLNKSAIVQCIFLPWLMFSCIFWLLSFWVHYYHPIQCYWAVFVILLGVAGIVGRAIYANKVEGVLSQRDYHKTPPNDSTWVGFLAITALLSWCGGVALGQYNFMYNTAPHYDRQDLRTAENVDPSGTSAQGFLDTSVATFAKGSYVDKSKSLGFKDGSVYCVAPITRGNEALTEYGFWAIGTDCCNPFGGAFWCGEGNSKVSYGYRLLDHSLRPYYMRAVEQAVAEYGLGFQSTKNPLFFILGGEILPTRLAKHLGAVRPAGDGARAWLWFRCCVFAHFCLQVSAVYAFASSKSKTVL